MDAVSSKTSPQARLPAVDLLRGLVMILMTVDHASHALNAGRVFTDSAGRWTPGSPLPTAQFLTRWITHLCAPTFVLLAGTALALSTASRLRRGDEPGAIDRHLAVRGLLLIALDAVWMSPVFLDPGDVLFQVLYAIGSSFLCMIALRRLPDGALLAVGFALAFLDEPLLSLLSRAGLAGGLPSALLVAGGFFAGGRFIVAYPLFPWLGIMCFGWVLGRRLLVWPAAERSRIAARTLTLWGAIFLAVFAVVRGANGFGNLGLLRDSGALAQWLHVSKYPPSISYITLELGIAALLLAGLFLITERRPDFAAPVRVLGQVALFYYLLHAHLLVLVAALAGVHEKLGLGATYLGTLAVLAALFPLCAVYRRYKASHPGGWRQYV
jgi:uncharacterized membrane protein